MPRDYRLYLEDIHEAALTIEQYTRGVTFEQFRASSQLSDAVLYRLVTIGEAVRNIPDSLRDRYPGIEWRKINALRNVVAHEYHAVKLETIWDIVTSAIPRLREDIETLLAEME